MSNGHELTVEDWHRVLAQTAEYWTELAGRRVMISGGSNVGGLWLLELLTRAIDRYRFECDVVVFTPNVAVFRDGVGGRIAGHPNVRLRAGDPNSARDLSAGFHFVAHFATPGATPAMMDRPSHGDALESTRQVLAFASRVQARRVLVVTQAPDLGGEPLAAPPTPVRLDDNAILAATLAGLVETTVHRFAQCHPESETTILRLGGIESLRLTGLGPAGPELAAMLWALLLRAERGTTWKIEGDPRSSEWRPTRVGNDTISRRDRPGPPDGSLSPPSVIARGR